MKNESFVHESLDKIRNDMLDIKNEVADLKDACTKNAFKEDFYRRVIDLERGLYYQSQYSRRETIEFVGVPDSIPDGEPLEGKVIEMCKVAGVSVVSRDLHAVHRLDGRAKTVICKFVNRRDALAVLRSKKKLRETNSEAKNLLGFSDKIYTNESLCGPYRMLLGKCNQLFKDSRIEGFWTVNGKLRIKMGGNGPTAGGVTPIGHEADLYNLFGREIMDKLKPKRKDKKDK